MLVRERAGGSRDNRASAIRSLVCCVFSGARRKARNLADVILCDAPQAPGKQVLLDSAREDLVRREHRAPARLAEMGVIQPPLQPQHL